MSGQSSTRRRDNWRRKFICGALGLYIVLALVSVASAEVQVGVSNPPNLDNLRLVAGQGTSFEIGVQNNSASENSRFKIENAGLSMVFSDNDFVLAPGTEKEVTVTVLPITTEGVYTGEISVSVYSLEAQAATPIVPVTGIPLKIIVGEPAPILVSPENNAVENTPTVTFTWSSPGTEMGYHIQIDDELSFTSPFVYENTDVVENYFSYTFGKSNQEYYWRVRARDNASNWSAWSESFKLTIVLEKPGELPIVPLTLLICVIAAGILLIIMKTSSKHLAARKS
jgi:hypothetical protein